MLQEKMDLEIIALRWQLLSLKKMLKMYCALYSIFMRSKNFPRQSLFLILSTNVMKPRNINLLGIAREHLGHYMHGYGKQLVKNGFKFYLQTTLAQQLTLFSGKLFIPTVSFFCLYSQLFLSKDLTYLSTCAGTRLDKQVLLHNIGSILVS